MFLRVRAAKVLVVGGGRVALRKCRDLLAAGARVRAVSPTFCPALSRISSVQLLKRRFRAADVHDSALVVAATDSTEVNQRVAGAARRHGIPVNVVDNPELSTFIVPAVLRRRSVVIAVSTGGASPALARNIRDRLRIAIGPGFGRHAAFLSRARPLVLKKVRDQRERRRIFERLAEDDVRQMIEDGKARRVNKILEEMIRESARSAR